MKRSFSFNRDPAHFIVETIPSLLPGIEKVVGVYCLNEMGKLDGIVLWNSESGVISEPLHVEDNNSRISKMRRDNSGFSWMGKEDIPFEILLKDKIQLNIFNEFNNNILLIKIFNSIDQLNDLFFIYFNQKIEKLGIVSFNRMMSTENKTIIAHLLRSSLLIMLETMKNDREIYFDLSESTLQSLSEVHTVKAELQKTKEKSKESIIRLSYSYLSEISAKNHTIYTLTDSAISKLKDFDGDPFSLKIILEKAADYAWNLNRDIQASETLINDYHLVFKDFQEKLPVVKTNEHIGNIPEIYRRTIHLLDRLENAASTLKSKNQLLTSQNIGNVMQTPVTPPAITDALKKHGQKIIHLFNEYPNRWNIIRSEFRPVQNMINAIHELKQESA